MGSARLLFCWVLIGLIPGSLLGADSGAAMLYANGMAWINGTSVPRSSALFPGDLVQTRPDAVVHINATGSSVMILSDSLVKYEGNAVSVEHGKVKVATTKGMSTRAGEVVVTPTSPEWTEFDVTDVNGTVEIVARKGDVSISNGTETTRLAQGEQTTRDDSENQKKKRRAAGAVHHHLSNRWTVHQGRSYLRSALSATGWREERSPGHFRLSHPTGAEYL